MVISAGNEGGLEVPGLPSGAPVVRYAGVAGGGFHTVAFFFSIFNLIHCFQVFFPHKSTDGGSYFSQTTFVVGSVN